MKVQIESRWIQLKWPGCSAWMPNELSTVQYIATIHDRPNRRCGTEPLPGRKRTTAPTPRAYVAPAACSAISGVQWSIATPPAAELTSE